jgi:hypothetical protein
LEKRRTFFPMFGKVETCAAGADRYDGRLI